MAKTFKHLSSAGESVAPKPTSERDFFDLTDDDAPVQKPATKAVEVHNISNTDNTSNTSITGNKTRAAKAEGTTALSAGTDDAPDGVRQTFVLSRGHLEQLRDYVHARRSQGEYTYSQKQALQEALDLLFATGTPAAPRPAQTREQEQQRRQRIQQGRRAGSSR